MTSALLSCTTLTVFQNDRAEATTVPARGKALIDTGLTIAVPEGTYGRVAPRSGLGPSSLHPARSGQKHTELTFGTASKFMIDTGAGVIDADYRGLVKVLLFNLSENDYQGNSWLPAS